MAARRGTPKHIYSDNGTNFVKANRIMSEEYEQLQTIFNNSFYREITDMNIEWHFNAPAWPTAGGLWERAVRSVKHHLKRVIGEQKLTFEEYSTLLARIESCLNSRPLCALTESVEDIDCLTPAHFLHGRAGTTVIETAEDARTRWQLKECRKGTERRRMIVKAQQRTPQYSHKYLFADCSFQYDAKKSLLYNKRYLKSRDNGIAYGSN
ncbi:unnamed protein product [Colias eurytheme]|nr:unnamed protein product [Colias eurytheme]